MGLESVLVELGLSKQEARVYLSSLKLGLAKASEIAKKSIIKREATYYLLKLLNEKGYISEIIKKGVKHYSAVTPKRILEIIEEEKQKKEEAIKSVMPELESLHKYSLSKPKVEFYEGEDSFKLLFNRLLEKKNMKLYGYIPEEVVLYLPSFGEQFRRKRREKNIFLKAIVEDAKYVRALKKRDKIEMREMRFNDVMKNQDTACYIIEDSIFIMKVNKKEQLGIHIKEKSFVDMQKKIFKKLWQDSNKK